MHINKFFDKRSEIYNKEIYKNRGSFYVADLEENFLKDVFWEKLSQKENLVLYDLGVGNARMSKVVLDNFKNKLSWYPIDFSKEMLKVLEKKNGNKITQSYHHDLNKKFLVNIKEKADLVISFRVIKYVKNLDYLLKTVNKITKKDSIIILQFANKYSFNVFLKLFSFFLKNKESKTYLNALNFYSKRKIKKLFQKDFKIIGFWGNIRLPYFLFNFLGRSKFLNILITLEKSFKALFGKSFLARDFVLIAKKK